MIVPPADPNLAHQLSEKPPLRDDTRFAAGKIAIFQYATVVIFLFLISGFWRLQVQNPSSTMNGRSRTASSPCPFPLRAGAFWTATGA